jgi:ubiquinone/menaquinone biosynthesis C-methylase UbiE
MHTRLLEYLCDPVDGSDLRLSADTIVINDRVATGDLVSANGRRYPIRNGVPRFLSNAGLSDSVVSFGDEWNHFNYDGFKANWIKHIAQGAFGSTDYFKGKLIVDCAAGSGMHTKWMSEYGASHVIALELSHSVDGVMQENLKGIDNVDVVQCSIDAPPIKPHSINGLVVCNAAIQHTPSVRKTAEALWRIVGPGGELSFSCYLKYPHDVIWMARWLLVTTPLRAVLSRCSFDTRLRYAKVMARMRMVPIIGTLLEKAQFVVRGDVPPGERYKERLLTQSILNTFDWYGAHRYQHYLSAAELAEICNELNPRPSQVLNLDAYYKRPLPPGLPLRLKADV